MTNFLSHPDEDREAEIKPTGELKNWLYKDRIRRLEGKLALEYQRSEILTEALELIAFGPGLIHLEDAIDIAHNGLERAMDVPRSPSN